MKEFIYGWGGALLCNQPIEGITQELDDRLTKDYGGRYFIAETMQRSAAKQIAKLLAGEEEFAFKEVEGEP